MRVTKSRLVLSTAHIEHGSQGSGSAAPYWFPPYPEDCLGRDSASAGSRSRAMSCNMPDCRTTARWKSSERFQALSFEELYSRIVHRGFEVNGGRSFASGPGESPWSLGISPLWPPGSEHRIVCNVCLCFCMCVCVRCEHVLYLLFL